MNAVQSNPPRIVTHWRRFSSGLWRVPEGDIAAAYCADTFPKIKVFTHEGRLFTNCGCNYSKYLAAEVNCYPLIPPDEYRGAENVPYSYEGREAAYKGRVFKLGAKVLFVASDPTLEEWRHWCACFMPMADISLPVAPTRNLSATDLIRSRRTDARRDSKNWLNAAHGQCPARRRKCAGCWQGNPPLKTNPNKLISRYDTDYQNHPARDRRNLRLWETRPQIGCRI